MAPPPVYLDECVHPRLAVILVQRGFRATSALHHRTLQLDDESQLDFATSLSAVLLTHDYRDFLRLHREYEIRGKAHAGIIILPRRSEMDLQELRASMMLDWLGTLEEIRNRFFRWGSLQQLLLGGYRVAGYREGEVRYVLGQRPRGNVGH
jgi:hypothetical protein